MNTLLPQICVPYGFSEAVKLSLLSLCAGDMFYVCLSPSFLVIYSFIKLFLFLILFIFLNFIFIYLFFIYSFIFAVTPVIHLSQVFHHLFNLGFSLELLLSLPSR